MKKLFTAVFATLLAASMSFALGTTVNSSAAKTETGKTTTAQAKAHKADKKGHKRGKKANPNLNPQPLPPRKAPGSKTTPQ